MVVVLTFRRVLESKIADCSQKLRLQQEVAKIRVRSEKDYPTVVTVFHIPEARGMDAYMAPLLLVSVCTRRSINRLRRSDAVPSSCGRGSGPGLILILVVDELIVIMGRHVLGWSFQKQWRLGARRQVAVLRGCIEVDDCCLSLIIIIVSGCMQHWMGGILTISVVYVVYLGWCICPQRMCWLH